MDAVETVGFIGWRTLPAQTAQNMMRVTDYRPKKVGFSTDRHVSEGGGVIRQEATPFSASHKTITIMASVAFRETLNRVKFFQLRQTIIE